MCGADVCILYYYFNANNINDRNKSDILTSFFSARSSSSCDKHTHDSRALALAFAISPPPPPPRPLSPLLNDSRVSGWLVRGCLVDELVGLLVHLDGWITHTSFTASVTAGLQTYEDENYHPKQKKRQEKKKRQKKRQYAQ